MNRTPSDQWLLFLVRGVFAMIFGVMALLMPAESFMGLVIFLGAFMIADGVLSILFSTPAKSGKPWGRVFMLGIAGIGVFILSYYNPVMAAVALLSLFVIWSFFSGLRDLMDSMSSHGRKGEGWYIISALLCILIVMLVLVNPFAGVVTLAMVFGLYALVTGTLLIFLSFRLKHRLRQRERRRYHEHLSHS